MLWSIFIPWDVRSSTHCTWPKRDKGRINSQISGILQQSKFSDREVWFGKDSLFCQEVTVILWSTILTPEFSIRKTGTANPVWKYAKAPALYLTHYRYLLKMRWIMLNFSSAFEDDQTTLLDFYVTGSWFGQCIPFQGSPHDPRGPESSNNWPLVSTRGGSNCNTCDESKKEGTIPGLNHEDLLYLSLLLPQTSSKI